MKIFLAQQNYLIGDFENNTLKILKVIEEAKLQGGDLVVFSELSVCGYPPRDFLYFNDFIEKSIDSINKIKEAARGIAVVVGAPQKNASVNGKRLYNSAYFLADGKIKAVIQKTCLPTYDVFDENRYFEPASQWNIIAYKGKKIAVTICEDIWNLGENPLYKICPMDQLISQSPDLMINLSASPFDYTHSEDRKAILKSNVVKYNLPVFYCNAVGSQTEIVFDGNSMVFDKQANLCGTLKSFEEDFKSYELLDEGTIKEGVLELSKNISTEQLNPDQLIKDLNIDTIYNTLVLGIKDYFKRWDSIKQF